MLASRNLTKLEGSRRKQRIHKAQNTKPTKKYREPAPHQQHQNLEHKRIANSSEHSPTSPRVKPTLSLDFSAGTAGTLSTETETQS